ncbi:DEAD/DEAH box helicase [Actinomyces sp. Z16]|uniref:DEAD/DEAH box helicase n=1 Tax=Actinomyces sp. Z16 TaxID=2079536 RepID=UPI001F17CE2E|nr:DEAD/DEAH box helicase [Actinomyces sp. Z16]
MTSPTGAPRLLPPLVQPPLPEPDASAARVLARATDGANLVVLGAPGTGKTTTALRLLVEAVTDRHKEALLLAPTRARADRLRERASHLLSLAGASSGTVRVRTPVGLALTILTTSFTQRPDPLPAPVLLAGAEEDAALAGLVPGADWGTCPPRPSSRVPSAPSCATCWPVPVNSASPPSNSPTSVPSSTSPSGGTPPHCCAPGTRRAAPAPPTAPPSARWTRPACRTAPARSWTPGRPTACASRVRSRTSSSSTTTRTAPPPLPASW